MIAKTKNVSQPKDYKLIVEKDVQISAYRHHHADYNIGAQNTIYAGGDRISYLLMPVISPVIR